MIPPPFIGPIQQGQPRPTRCEPCHAVYRHFGFDGRCRNIRDGMVAHLTNLDYHFGEALCTLRQQLIRDRNRKETTSP